MGQAYPFDTASHQRATPVIAGQTFFLDNSNSNKADSPANGTYMAPFSTIAYALTQCTAAAGDTIFVMPGHTETVATILAATTKSRVMILAPHLGINLVMSSVSGSFESAATERLVARATATLPQTATGTIFTVTAGPVLVRELFGIVTTAIQAQATTLRITSTATGLSAVTLSGATGDINAAAIGTVVSITGTLATDVQITANANHVGQATPIYVGAGTIGITTGASSTGSMAWYCRYAPLAPGAYVIAA